MAGWRSTALVAVTGLVSGTFGAIAYGHFTKPSGPRPAASSTEHPEARASVIPPGWDPTLVSRLANVEEKLDKLGSPVARWACGGESARVFRIERWTHAREATG